MEVIKVSSIAYTSEAMPEANDSDRIVQSYAVVYNYRSKYEIESLGWEAHTLTLKESIGSNLTHDMDDLDVAGQCICRR